MAIIQRRPSPQHAIPQKRRTTLKTLTAEILACKAGIGRSIYEIGIRLARIQEQELWRAVSTIGRSAEPRSGISARGRGWAK